MKYFIIFFLLVPSSLWAQKFKVSVVLLGMPDRSKFYLIQDSKKDSALSKNQILTFHVLKETQEPLHLVLQSANQKQSYVLLLDNRPTIYKGSFKNNKMLSADHSPSQNDMKDYLELTDSTSTRLMNISDIINNCKLSDSLERSLKAKNAYFIKSHKGSPLSPIILAIELGRKHLTKEEAYTFYLHLNKQQQSSTDGKKLLKTIKFLNFPQPGAVAPNFSMSDINGKRISLNNYRGKTVVLIFWSSSCVPCRWEAPQLIQLHDTCKNKNVEFISISLDDNKESWAKAMLADKCPWLNVSDLQGWASEAALLYGIRAIPEHVIIDGNGIIAKRPGPIWDLKDQLLSVLNIK